MSQFDLTLAITAHAETLEAGPAMRSAELAIAAVEEAGFAVQRLLGFDTPTPQTTRYFGQPRFDAWERHSFAFADQGETRSALADIASGRYLAFLDADDLLSSNWLLAAMTLLEAQSNDRMIAHPELIWQFDGSNTVYTQPSQSSPLFTPHHFAMQNYYDALCLAPRQAWQEVRYAPRDVQAGYAYEDWQWALETIEAGWEHVSVPDTLIFKRRRDVSQSQAARARRVSIRSVAPLAIDTIAGFGRQER
ncbi:glycosyltransferase family 2 protein [Lentibacter algarum]|uniref:glycosyltransferase family A protein n=1 Tax=Lentibacter algarum TaxID=576131 RepID=UPI001C069997|nr:glycosyltransferase family A protein [Lentibacter algarum]MBU2980654.1 glycosyltransferase family 2 protein [Lentibacter algarum]